MAIYGQSMVYRNLVGEHLYSSPNRPILNIWPNAMSSSLAFPFVLLIILVQVNQREWCDRWASTDWRRICCRLFWSTAWHRLATSEARKSTELPKRERWSNWWAPRRHSSGCSWRSFLHGDGVDYTGVPSCKRQTKLIACGKNQRRMSYASSSHNHTFEISVFSCLLKFWQSLTPRC